jgi:hypothetical protein
LATFLLFLGFAQAYERYQNPLLIKEALLVAPQTRVSTSSLTRGVSAARLAGCTRLAMA